MAFRTWCLLSMCALAAPLALAWSERAQAQHKATVISVVTEKPDPAQHAFAKKVLASLRPERARATAKSGLVGYRHYHFDDLSKIGKGATRREERKRFDALIHLPELDLIFSRTPAESDELGNIVFDWTPYAGRFLRMVVSPDLRSVNLTSFGQDGSFTSATDLDGDHLVDLLDAWTARFGRDVIASDELGAWMLKEWGRGEDPFCRGARALGFACPEGSGGSAGPAGGGPRGSLDPLADLCAGRTRRPRIGGALMQGGQGPSSSLAGRTVREHVRLAVSMDWETEGGQRTFIGTREYYDREGNLVATYRTEITYLPDGGVRRVEERTDGSGRGTRTTTTRTEDGTTTTTTETIEPESAPTAPDTTPPDTSSSTGLPGPDDEGEAQALERWCAGFDHPYTRPGEGDDDNPGDIDIECRDLVESSASSSEDPRCGFHWSREEDVEDLLDTGGAGNDCAPYARPGSDGQCVESSFARLRGAVARLGASSAPGFEACDPLLCDPEF